MSRKKSILAEGQDAGDTQYQSMMAEDGGSSSAKQATVPFSIRLSSHVICGRGADSNLQVSPQRCESRRPQHGRCHGLIINVP